MIELECFLDSNKSSITINTEEYTNSKFLIIIRKQNFRQYSLLYPCSRPTLKMEAAGAYGTLTLYYQTTRYPIENDRNC